MNLFTSNFAKSGAHPNAVSIARYSPRWFKGKRFLKLAPSSQLLKSYKAGTLSESKFKEVYENLLSQLDPVKISRELGHGSVLLCYEKIGDACHRHYVADWFKKAGINVSELKTSSRAVKSKTIPPQEPKKRQMPKGLSEKGQRIYNLLETYLTYPAGHNQAVKIKKDMEILYSECTDLDKDKIKISFLK